MADTPPENGDCYVVAARLVTGDGAPEDALLCHGTCTGHGPIKGITFGHAWVEWYGMVVEQSNGHDAVLPRDVYYEAGRCREVVRYTPDEARRMMQKHGHYGPWEGRFAPTTEDTDGTDN